MIYVQHGPMWKPKIDELLEKRIIDGIVWDPREETIERITNIKESNHNYNEVDNLIDLKWFYKQFQNSEMKRLEELDYFPDEIIDRNYFRDVNELELRVKKMVDFENKLGVTEFISPSLYMASFNERIIDRIFDIDDLFYNETKDKGKGINLALIIHESAFDNESYMNDFINDISNYVGKYTGIYLIIDRDNNNTIRHGFSETRLSMVLKLIYSFKKMKFKVIMGYSGIESINYMALGVDVICTGWFYSLRKFNRLEKGLEEYSNMGRAKKRYLSLNLLSEITIDDNIQSIPDTQKDSLYDLIFSGNSDTQLVRLIKSQTYDTIPIKDTFIQYFQAMKQMNEMFESIEDINGKITKLEKMLDSASDNIKIYNTERTGIAGLTEKHIVSYKNAINRFKEENYIM